MKLSVTSPSPSETATAGHRSVPDGSPSSLIQQRGRAQGTSRRIALVSVLLAFTFLNCTAKGQSASGSRHEKFPEVETTWPGVRFQLYRVERNSLNRIVVAVRIIATNKAPISGTSLGSQTAPPPDATPEERTASLYNVKPFSLTSSQMIDELTGRKYSVLPSISPPGTSYLPSYTFVSLFPGQAELLTIQFEIPPWLGGGDPTRKQTVSFLFPNAKAPMTKVPVPQEITDLTAKGS